MADDEEKDEVQEEVEDEEEWTEPVELEGLDDGHTTTFLGGFSPIRTMTDALTRIKRKNDQIIVLSGTYDTGVTLDSTLHDGLRFFGDAQASVEDIVFRGTLEIQYTVPEKKDAPPPTEEEDESGKKKVPEPPRPLTIGHMTFLSGVVAQELTNAHVLDVTFGQRYVHPPANEEEEIASRLVRCHGLSTSTFEECTVFGVQTSAVYCFPYSRVTFSKCTFQSAEQPPPPAPTETRKKKKVVRPPTPPPAVPTREAECEVGIQCDDAQATFNGCTLRGFDIGIVFSGKCKGTKVERCKISEILTVGILFGKGASAAVRNNVVKLCGRETVVVSAEAHPILRDNILVGDARVARGAVGTGICDNILGLNGQLFDEEKLFTLKGFRTVEKDPSIVKPKKIVEEEE